MLPQSKSIVESTMYMASSLISNETEHFSPEMWSVFVSGYYEHFQYLRMKNEESVWKVMDGAMLWTYAFKYVTSLQSGDRDVLFVRD